MARGFQAIGLALAGRTDHAGSRVAHGLALAPEFRSRTFFELGSAAPLTERFTDGARLLGLPEWHGPSPPACASG